MVGNGVPAPVCGIGGTTGAPEEGGRVNAGGPCGTGIGITGAGWGICIGLGITTVWVGIGMGGITGYPVCCGGTNAIGGGGGGP